MDMDVDIKARCGAGYHEKNTECFNSRNGYRERTWDTRAGSVPVKIPKPRQLLPRIPGAPSYRREGAHRGHSGGLHPGHFHPLGGRPAQGAGHEWRLQEPGKR